jgi:O-antigen ligase
MQTSFEVGLPAPRRSFIRETVAAATAGPKISFALLIVFLLMLYSSIAIMVPQLNPVRPVLLVAVGALGMLIVELAQERQSIGLTWPQTPLLIAFVGIAAVSTTTALYAKLAFETTLDFSKIVLIYLVMENTITNESRMRKVFWTLVIGGLFPAIGTVQHYFAGILIEGSRGSWVGVFKNPNEDAYCLAILVPLAVALMPKARWPARILLVGIIGAYLAGIFFTFSRGGLLGVVAGLGLVGWKQKSYLLKVGMAVVLVVGIVVAGAFWARSKDFSNVAKDATVLERMGTIIAGGRMFLDHPLLGVGPGCSMVAYPLYVPREYFDCGCNQQLVIHNAFVQVLSETGALGFICFMSLLGVSLIDSRRMQSGPLTSYTRGLEIALWVFIVCGLSGGFTYTWSPYLCVGLIVAAKRISASTLEESPAR